MEASSFQAYQVKVEYGFERWINFLVDVSGVYCGNYKFGNLADDIVNRCPSLSHLNTANIRIRHEDDEGCYINLNFGDEYGFRDMWNNAKTVSDREYRRIKIKACEINSPCGIAGNMVKNSVVPEKTRESASTCFVQDEPAYSQTQRHHPLSTMKPRQLYVSSDNEANHDYEELFTKRGKKLKFFPDDSERESQSELSVATDSTYALKTPVERLFVNLENDITNISQEIEDHNADLKSLKDAVNSARTRNNGGLSVCMWSVSSTRWTHEKELHTRSVFKRHVLWYHR